MKLVNKYFSIFAIVLAFSFALSACSDDKKKPNPGTDAGQDASSGDDAATGDDAGDDDAAVPSGACTNAADLAALGPIGNENAIYGDDNDQTVKDVTGDCAIGEIATPDEEKPAAVAECVNTKTDNAVTSDCVNCYVATTLCGFANCVSECIADTNSPGCTACLCENNCIGAFETCSGRPSDLCDN